MTMCPDIWCEPTPKPGCHFEGRVRNECGCVDSCGTEVCDRPPTDDECKGQEECPIKGCTKELRIPPPGCKREPMKMDACGCIESCPEIICPDGPPKEVTTTEPPPPICDSRRPCPEDTCERTLKAGCRFKGRTVNECGCVVECGEMVCDGEPEEPKEETTTLIPTT